MTGLCIFLDSNRSPFRTLVQVAGPARRIAGERLLQELDRSGNEVQNLIRRYAAGFLAQVSHLAACNQLHPVKRRCCRMLLSTADRLGAEEVPLTQEFLAVLLGVRRASVGEVMGELKTDKLITYSRGRITLLDRPALEASVCECYRHIRDAAGRVFEPAG
jgi:CRP-like cAMP-binding protein